MTDQIDFYLLGSTNNAAKFKYACRIANKAYSQGMKIYIQTHAQDQSLYLDKLLWTFSQESFVPHTIREHGTDWVQYPVQIGHRSVGQKSDAAPDIDLLISLQSDVPEDYANYRRVADLVIDEPQDKQLGRARFRTYRDNGIEPKTHQVR